jgi:hypothetical protein
MGRETHRDRILSFSVSFPQQGKPLSTEAYRRPSAAMLTLSPLSELRVSFYGGTVRHKKARPCMPSFLFKRREPSLDQGAR